MADVPYSDFVTGLAVDSIGGSEKMPVVDGSTPKHVTPNLLSAYAVDQLHGAAVITTIGDSDEVVVFQSDVEKIITAANVSAWMVDELEAITTGTSIVSGDKVLYVDGGVLKQIDIDTIVTFVNSENGTLGAQVDALSAATLADTDEYLVEQGGTAKKSAFSAIAARVHTQLSTFTAALDATVTPVDADKLYVLQGSTAKYVTMTVLANTYLAAELDIEDFGWGMAEADPAASGDMILMERSGTRYKVDVDTMQTFMGSGLQATVLTLSGLAAAVPNAADLFAVDDSGTAKKITLANLETKLWADYAAHVIGLDAVATTAASDKFYCIQGSTAKYVTPAELATYFGVTAGDVTGPVTTTENKIPQWDDDTKELKDGLTLVTTITPGGATDAQVPTAQAVDELYTGLAALDIDGASDIGAALEDADLIIVDDGATGANRKSTVSRVWTYIVTKIQALSNKPTPVGADILTIQDSADSNALKELTITNLDNHFHPSLAVTAGSGFTAAVASYVEGVEKVGSYFKTTIAIDLTGLRSTAGGDIIGDDGTADPCHIGQITAARNGTIFAGKIECLEIPAGGDPDIDLYSATEATGSEDDAITGLTETKLIDAGDHAVNAFKSLTAFPAANEYLYLVAGDTTNADYTTGILLIELWGK